MNKLQKEEAVGMNQQHPKRKVEDIMKENLELMSNIQKKREQFCNLVGGC